VARCGPSKKLKGAAPDLKIILHYTMDGDGDENGIIGSGGGVEQHRSKEYEHYSQILCSVSGMIDTTLSVDMMKRTTRIVHIIQIFPTTPRAAGSWRQSLAVRHFGSRPFPFLCPVHHRGGPFVVIRSSTVNEEAARCNNERGGGERRFDEDAGRRIL
jgi:hypothetical protein